MTEPPKRYSIEALLNSGVQPFADLDDEALDALGRGIGRRALAVPVAVTSDGILVDGHQRLKSMRAKGRTWIEATDVRVIADANADNALEWSVRLNVQRRHLTVAQKAEVARRLQRERKWSQAKVAQIFGVSRPAVSQWLKDDTDRPDTVIGKDGVEQPVVSRAKKPPKPTPHPWDLYAGDVLKLVEKTTARLRGARPHRDSLTDKEWEVAVSRLQELEVEIDECLARDSWTDKEWEVAVSRLRELGVEIDE